MVRRSDEDLVMLTLNLDGNRERAENVLCVALDRLCHVEILILEAVVPAPRVPVALI